MHMLCLLAIAICLLHEQVVTKSLPIHSVYPLWPRAQEKVANRSGEGWYWVRDLSTDCVKRIYLYSNGHPTCGEGVWMRIGFFDMT